MYDISLYMMNTKVCRAKQSGKQLGVMMIELKWRMGNASGCQVRCMIRCTAAIAHRDGETRHVWVTNRVKRWV